jgi:flagellar hook-associated protein 3 FlgL
MRVPTTQFYLQGIEAFGQQQSKLVKLQQQISTGVRLINPSDDPVAASKVLGLDQTIQRQKQYQQNISIAENRLKLQETILISVENVSFRLKELSIQAHTGAIGQGDRDVISVEVKQRLDELIGLANTKDASGDYLFAGYQSRAEPFSASKTGSIEHVTYQGDQGTRSLQISESRQVQVDNSGSEIFLEIPSQMALNESAATGNSGSGVISPAQVFNAATYVPSNITITFTSATEYNVIDSATPANDVTGATYEPGDSIDVGGVRFSITGSPVGPTLTTGGDVFTTSSGKFKDPFESIQTLADTLDKSDSTAQRTENYAMFLEDLDNFFNKVLEVRTSIGGRLNALESQKEANEADIFVTQAMLSTLRDTDLAEAISQLTLEQATLEAAQAVFSRITSSSLFNYLR